MSASRRSRASVLEGRSCSPAEPREHLIAALLHGLLQDPPDRVDHAPRLGVPVEAWALRRQPQTVAECRTRVDRVVVEAVLDHCKRRITDVLAQELRGA